MATRRDLINQFRSKKLVEEMIQAGWIELVLRGGPGRTALFDYASAERAAERLKAGEEPQGQPTGRPKFLQNNAELTVAVAKLGQAAGMQQPTAEQAKQGAVEVGSAAIKSTIEVDTIS